MCPATSTNQSINQSINQIKSNQIKSNQIKTIILFADSKATK